MNQILFDFEPPEKLFSYKDMMDWIAFINYGNVKGVGILQANFPWMYRIPLERNRRRRAKMLKFRPLVETLYQRQRQLRDRGVDCLIGAAEAALGREFEKSDDAKTFLFGLYTAAMLTSLTTASCLLQNLSSNPMVAQALTAEAKRCIPNLAAVQYQDLEKMNMIRAFVKETLRTASPVPVIPRSIGKVDIYLSLQDLNQSPDLYPNAQFFDPKRFIHTQTGKVIEQFAHQSFLPFGLGKRSCPGREYVQFEFILMTALLVRKHRVKRNDITPDEADATTQSGDALDLAYIGPVPHVRGRSSFRASVVSIDQEGNSSAKEQQRR